MTLLDDWPHKAEGNFQGKRFFLLGTVHSDAYIPLVKQVLETFSPQLILLENSEEKEFRDDFTPEMHFAAVFAQENSLKVGLFDVNFFNLYKEIAQNCSLIDGFIIFIYYTISGIMTDPNLGRRLSSANDELIAAIKHGDERAANAALLFWLPDAVVAFRHLVRFSPADADRILGSEKVRNYRDAAASGLIVDSTAQETPAAVIERESVPIYRSPNAPNFFEKPQCVAAHMAKREEKMFENIQKISGGEPPGAKILVITGTDHFDFLKEKLNL